MAWSGIIGQERIAMALRSALRGGRVAHAYLFHGADGVGKRAVAIEFARALLCRSGGDEACDECDACHKSARALHADLSILMPQPKDADHSEVAERVSRLFENRYATVDFARRPSLDDPEKTSNKQARYHVGRIHEELYRPMSFKPVEGRYKIAIITDVDLFNKESANSFLKLLEEPSSRTVFILTTARIDHVLPTIQSRCQRMRFSLLESDVIVEHLVSAMEIEPDYAEVIARMADGSVSRAVDLGSNKDLAAMRQGVLELFRLIWKARDFRPEELDALTDVAAQTSSYGRERTKIFLRLILAWLRDIVLYRNSGSVEGLVNIDSAEAVANFSDRVPEADVAAMIGVVEEAIGLTQRNVHLGLLMLAMFNELRRAMRGEPGAQLYRPLVEEPFVVGAG